ncbi:hypothetical protein [Rhizobium sp. SAFR-030]|uniref:hypothetical protein n=1 Tax=Rhizobium sp. SAFR-030 TaxID=3387277 RepID=UPI003F7D7677
MDGLDKLPLPVLISIGLGLAVIFAVRYLGLMSGQRAAPSQASAQVAAVIVDPTALNKMTEQATRLVDVLEEMVDQAKEKIRVDGALAQELDHLREELRIYREISRR